MKKNFTKAQAFTLVELLVVIAIIGVLASLLLPVINRAKSEGRRARCISNIRQISIGWLSYSVDWDAYVPYSDANEVITGHWALKLGPYVGARWSDKVFHCPDYRHTNELIRPGFFLVQRGSYDINVSGNAGPTASGRGVGGTMSISAPPFMTLATKVSEVRMPEHLIAMGDVSVDSRFVYMDYGYLDMYFYADQYAGGKYPAYWLQLALGEFNRRHRGMFNMQFADGHIESGKPNRFFKLDVETCRLWNNDYEPHWGPGSNWPY